MPSEFQVQSHHSDRSYVATYLAPLYPSFILCLIDSCVPESTLVACQGDLCRPPCNKLLMHIACVILPPTRGLGSLYADDLERQ